MKKWEKRLGRLKEQTPFAPRFIAWRGNPWTPEQKRKAIRLEPNRRIFWRSLLDENPCGADALKRDTNGS